MEAFLPTEIARLVYGYLKEEECDQAAQIFLETSKHLVECLMVARKGRKFHTRVLGRNLVDILDLLSEVTCLVRGEVKSNASPNNENNFLKNLIRILGIDECETLVSNTTNTVYLSISVPAQEDVKKKAPAAKVVEHVHFEENTNQLTKQNSPNSKAQDEKSNEEEDALFDLNMLNTLLDNTTLHKKLAENINKAISTGENTKQKGEDEKIIETILHNTEADPIFEEIVCDLAAPRADESTTPEDTEVEGGETGDENKSGQAPQETDDHADCINAEQHLEEQNDEAIRGILAIRNTCISQQAEDPLEVTSMPSKPSTMSLVELAMESAGVTDETERTPSSPISTVPSLLPGPDMKDNPQATPQELPQVIPTEQPASLHQLLPPHSIPVQTITSQIQSQTTSSQLCTQYSLLQVLPSNLTTLYIQPSSGMRVGSMSSGGVVAASSTPLTGQQQFSPVSSYQLAPAPPASQPPQHNIYTLDDIPPVPPRVIRPLKPKPIQPKPGSSDNEVVKPLEEQQPAQEAPIIKRSGVRTRGGFRKVQGRQKRPILKAVVPMIKSIKDDLVNIELVECPVERNVHQVRKSSPIITKRSLRPRRNNRTTSPENSADSNYSGTTLDSRQGEATVSKDNTPSTTSIKEVTQNKSLQELPEESHNSQQPQTSIPTVDLITASGEEKDETPEHMKVVSARKKQRLSLSTPRRGSHVRNLDFRTPVKRSPIQARRANTSPKNVPPRRLMQFQKSLRKVCRTSLFKSPAKEEKAKKPWDADLRLTVGETIGETIDIPSSIGLKRTSQLKGQDQPPEKSCSKDEKSKEDNIPPKIHEKINSSGSSLEPDPEVSIDELATSDDIVKHIQKEVLDVIGEEDLTLTLSPDKFKKSTSDEIPAVILVDETGNTSETPLSPEKQVKKPQPVKHISEVTCDSNKHAKSLPNVIQTPTKLDFAGVLPKTPVPMTPLSRIIHEEITILDGRKLLTPGFPPTPQNNKPPENVSPDVSSTIPTEEMEKTPPISTNVTLSPEKSFTDPSPEQSKNEIKSPRESNKKTPPSILTKAKKGKVNKSLSPKNLKIDPAPLRKSLEIKSPSSSKKAFRRTKKDDYFQDEHFIKQCLQSAKEELFGGSDSSSDSSSLSDSSVTECVMPKSKIESKKSKLKDKKSIDDKTIKQAEKPESQPDTIKPPSFDVAMKRFKTMTYLSEDSSSDDSIFIGNNPIARPRLLEGKGLSEEEASRDSFPRLHLSDEETNHDDYAKNNKNLTNEKKKNIRAEDRKINLKKEAALQPKNAELGDVKRKEERCTNNISTPEKPSPEHDKMQIGTASNNYDFLKTYTETYTVVSSETGEAVKRVFEVSPVLSLFGQGLNSLSKEAARSCVKELSPRKVVQAKRWLSPESGIRPTQKYFVRTSDYSRSHRQEPSGSFRDEIRHEEFRRDERRKNRWPPHYRGRYSPKRRGHQYGHYPKDSYQAWNPHGKGRGRTGVAREDRDEGARSRSGEKVMWERSPERNREYRQKSLERVGDNRNFDKKDNMDFRDGSERSLEREKNQEERKGSSERKVVAVDRDRNYWEKDRDRSLKWSKSSNHRKSSEKDKRHGEWSGERDRSGGENSRERSYRDKVPEKERIGRDRGGGGYTEIGERTFAEKGYRDRGTERNRDDKDRGRGGGNEWRRVQPPLRTSGDPLPRFRKDQDLQDKQPKAVMEHNRGFGNPKFTSTPLPTSPSAGVFFKPQALAKKGSLDAITPSTSSRSVKRKFVDEKEEGELSDCSSVQVAITNVNKEPKMKKRQSDLEYHLEHKRRVLKKVDLDHFLSIVHGDKEG